eukprot:TRINITY_DN9369_c0_g1_i9.p1 TRINITY_DN9369_c0_g1~~TRINITY_DN9369_c0_g1_i9.p1  ORF type:complete len:223 (-),score=43.95 TRINITY_DN9369_c0_g1_i9:223-891(-)
MEMEVQNPTNAQISDADTRPISTKKISKINWANYNFPPCVRIVHFSLSELHGALKRFVLCIYLSFLLIVAVLLTNSNSSPHLVLSTIILVSKYTSGINIFFTFLSTYSTDLVFVIFVPSSGFTAYTGYSAACRRPTDTSVILRYRLCQGVLCILWLVFSFIKSGSFNGWARIKSLVKEKEAAADFCIFLTVVESAGYTLALILGIIGILKIGSVFWFATVDC